MVSARIHRQNSSLDEGVFQCEGPCRRILPESMKVEQDGYDKCSERCAHTWSRTDDVLKLAAAQAIVDDQERASLKGVPTPFSGAVAVTAISPRPLELTAGGASGTLALTGVNLATGDTIDYGHASITGVVTVNSSTSVSIAVTAAGGLAAGYYDLTYEDSVFRNVFLVH